MSILKETPALLVTISVEQTTEAHGWCTFYPLLLLPDTIFMGATRVS